jgi:hypothetical protein
MKLLPVAAVILMSPILGFYCYVTPWTRYAPGFDKAAFRGLTPGVPAETVLSVVGLPLYAWIHDGATRRNHPLTPDAPERVLRAGKVMEFGGMERVAIFYSTSRFRWLSYESNFVLLTNGVVAGTGRLIQD